MLQIAAALLFAAAAGLGLTVIVMMLKTNGQAVLSALAGEGAFPSLATPQPDPVSRLAAPARLRHRHAAPRRASHPLLSRAA